MFRLLWRLIKLAIILAVVAVMAAFFLPRQYEHEVNAEIAAPQEKIFAQAKNLSSWHLAVAAGSIDPGQYGSFTSPTGIRIDSILPFDEAKKFLNVKLKLLETSPPASLSYRLDGGPMPGIEPRMEIIRVDDHRTRVFIKESYQFPGFFGGIKALTAKYGSGQINKASLDNLKALCERP
jgi:hypothetical protein